MLFNSSLNQYNNYGTTRYDTDLLKLHTTEEFYLSDELDDENEIKNFNADEKLKKSVIYWKNIRLHSLKQ